MLFVISEIRALAGEINKKFYVFSLCAATFFVGVGSIPMVIYYLSTATQAKYLPHNIALVGVFFYLAARLVSFVISSCEEKSEDGEI
jgi:hypothetical protein